MMMIYGMFVLRCALRRISSCDTPVRGGTLK